MEEDRTIRELGTNAIVIRLDNRWKVAGGFIAGRLNRQSSPGLL